MNSKEAYFQDLESIVTDQVYLTTSRDELKKEIAENMWTIGVSEELSRVIAPEEVQAFLQRVKRNRREQLTMCGQPVGLRYYLWHDPQAGQLRFNFISILHESLPFRAPVTVCADEASIIRVWLQVSGAMGSPLMDSVQVYEEVLLSF